LTVTRESALTDEVKARRVQRMRVVAEIETAATDARAMLAE
jgi:hypothetical protein